MVSLFSSKNTYVYLIITIIIAIIILAILATCNCENYLCFQMLEVPCYFRYSRLMNLFLFIVFFFTVFIAGAYADYMAFQWGKNNSFIQSIRILWLSIILLILIWFILLFTAINLTAALVCSFFLILLLIFYIYIVSNASAAATWVIVALFFMVLVLFAYTNCLYQLNPCDINPCVRNSIFC